MRDICTDVLSPVASLLDVMSNDQRKTHAFGHCTMYPTDPHLVCDTATTGLRR